MEPSDNVQKRFLWEIDSGNDTVTIEASNVASGIFDLDFTAGQISSQVMITRERAEALREMLDVVLRHRPAWAAETKRLNETHIKLFIGDEVVDVDGNKGIVVKIEYPADDDHGINFKDSPMIYVWQSEKPLDYGCDNCRQYPYAEWRSLLRVMK